MKEKEKGKMLNILNLVFPAMIVLGALGAFVISIIQEKGVRPIALQWFGAAVLYLGLLLRNID